jgi:hypothetical protein
MLGKIAQLRHRLASAVTSLESQRPLPPSDPQLPRKLQFLLEHILKQPQQAQFKAYHELQSPDYQLNELLAQIHHAQPDLDQLTAILHFYTFLLLNCKNELVLCKLVSAPLVLALTRFPSPQQPHMQDLDSYRIALLRAYVQRLDSETVKYMMVGDRLPVF